MESKLTAVEWLENELEQFGSPSNLNLNWTTFDELIEQAKAMEKEQSITDYKHGQNNGYMYRDGNGELIQAEQYYNETYLKL